MRSRTTRAYRLPTEFEWEYAARAGEDADTPWPQIREQAIAGYNAYFSTHMVGEKKPNAWGLYDTIGQRLGVGAGLLQREDSSRIPRRRGPDGNTCSRAAASRPT